MAIDYGNIDHSKPRKPRQKSLIVQNQNQIEDDKLTPEALEEL